MQFIITGFADEIDKNVDIQLESIRALGMQYFDPRNVDGKVISLLSEEEAKALAEKMKQYGIGAGCIGSRIGKISITDEFAPHMEELENTIRVAKCLGTKYIRIFSFYIPEGEKPDAYRDAVMDRMRQMAALAEKEGVILLHENEKGIYGDTAARCVDVLKTVASPALRCVFDPANFVQCGEQPYEAFEMLFPYISYMHIKDARADGVNVPAGEGLGEIPEILKYLSEKNYNGFLCLEPHLGAFDGLEALEQSDEMLKLEKSDAGKFATAYYALEKILQKL